MSTKEEESGGSSALLSVETHHREKKASSVVFVITDNEKVHFYPHFKEGIFPEARFLWSDKASHKDLLEQLAEINPEAIVTCWSSPALPDNLPANGLDRLRYVCHTTGTVRRVVPRRLIEEGLIVSNWGRSITNTVAEHALLLILASLRKMSQWRIVLESGKTWIPWGIETQTLYGRRVGLHGFGAVGQYLSALLRPFGGTIQAYSEGLPQEFYDKHGVRRCDSLEELFSTSEIVVECEALNPRTNGIVNRKMLRLLPEGALFINVGRAAVTNENELMEEARSGRIQIALDVYTQEPLPSASPLLELDAVLTPHIAGPTIDRFPACGQWAFHNLKRYFEGKPVESRVTLEVYDRST